MIRRLRAFVVFSLLLGLVTSPASAFTFNLINDGSSQVLTWVWEYQQSTFYSCHSSPFPCGNVNASNGRIPQQGIAFNILLKAGGMLDWTASSGSLKTVAIPTVYVRPSNNFQWANAWAAVNARDTPLDFIVSGEPGDPFPLDLQLLIRPRLLANVDHFTYPNGGQADLFVQMEMSVSVNGLEVTKDTLTRQYSRANGQQGSYPLAFPKGTSNNVVVPGVTNGSVVSIRMWAYVQGYATGNSILYLYSPYGDGPAIEIQVSDANAVAVEDQPLTAALSLAASPNPARGPARISYVLPRASDVRLAIYDVAGHRIARLRDGREPAGRAEVTWSGKSDDGRLAPAGIYLVELMAGPERRVQRLAVFGGQ